MSEENINKTTKEPFKKGEKSDRNDKGQFVEGHSKAGPGRPKGSVSITTEIKRKLAETPTGQKITYLEGLIKRILTKAVAEGDQQMIKMIWNYVDGMPKQHTELSGAEGLPFLIKIVKGANGTTETANK